MQSVAAVYNRIEREALRHDREPLYAWLSRRTDNAVKEAIKHGMRMANDPDYRLGVEAGRFARDYAEAFEGFIGTGERGQRYRGLQEGALRLRAGGDTVSGAAATRREVERLLGVMRAEVEAARAPAAVDEEPQFILWGRPAGETDALYEKPLYTKGRSLEDVERVKAIAARDGWHTFRVQRLDLSQPFDAQAAFAGGVGRTSR